MSYPMFRLLPGTLAITVVASLALSAQADPAEDLVESVYGQRLRDVAASRDFDDDLALAREILDVASNTTDGATVVAVLCERVFQLGNRRAEGLSSAVDAMVLAADRVPDKRSEYLERAATTQQRLFTSTRGAERDAAAARLVDLFRTCADARVDAEQWNEAALCLRKALSAANSAHLPIAEQLRRELLEVQNRPRLYQRADQLKQQIKDNRDDKAAADALIELYLVGLDNPDEARKYSFLSADADLIEGVRLASTGIDQLTGSELIAVGDLYMKLYEKAAPESRHRMLIRAFRAYAGFLDGAAPDHADRLKGELAVKQLRDQLDLLGIDADQLHRPASDNRIEVTFSDAVEFIGHSGKSLSRSSFSPDGTQLVTAGDDGMIRIWDAPNARELESIDDHEHGREVYQVKWSSDGQWIVSAGSDRKVVIWSTSLRRARATIPIGVRVYAVDVTSDGKRIAVGGEKSTLAIYAPASSSKPIKCTIPDDDGERSIYSVAFSPDGRLLAAAGTRRGVLLYDAVTGSRLTDLEGHWRDVYRVAFSADGKWLFSGSADGTTRMWNVANRSSAGLIDRTDHPVHGLAVSPDGRLVASALENGTVRLLDTHFRTLAGVLQTGYESCSGLAFDSLGQRLLVTGQSPIAKVTTLNRSYAPAAEPITRSLPLAYFWSPTRRVFEFEEDVLSLKTDLDSVKQWVYAHADGRYEVRIRAYGELAGDEPPRLEVFADKSEEPAATFEVTAGKLQPKTYTAAIELTRGGHNIAMRFANEFSEGESKDRNIHIVSVELVGIVEPGEAPVADEPETPDAPDTNEATETPDTDGDGDATTEKPAADTPVDTPDE